MSYYKTKKKINDMDLNDLLEAKKRHIKNPKYHLKIIKPPFYYTWLSLLENRIYLKLSQIKTK
ncbi:hypothetical protein Harreka1_63 [Olleya phage Harreka_1]|uniref:Uncharacterized protein n=1 Tax=Olleya phage Harreka_1 TaxID=2745673 RepID=A0A8E4ZLR5_9CAUD|nr:hypothetical protein M1M26_gp63 [Olleya phage Harreka_1]QQV90470.1 hypothetical protein Harreka1_63 [Olleya phage Harreka_1]